MRQEVDIRYVVTSLEGTAQHLYEDVYCQRGQMENTTHAPPVQRMPAILDHNILPDMGRMTARLRWGESRGSSPVPSAALTEQRP